MPRVHFVRLIAAADGAADLVIQGIPMRHTSKPGARDILQPLAAAAALSFAASAAGADIGEIYAEAVNKDPILASARANHAISREQVTIARSQLLPNVFASASRSKSSSATDAVDLNPSSPNFGNTNPPTHFTSQNWGANINQTVVNMGTWFNFRSAQARAKQGDSELETAAQNLIIRVASAYLNVLTQQANLESAVAAEEAVRRQLEQVQQRFDVGLEAITGVLESKAAYDLQVETRIQAESDHRISFEALRTLTGVAYDAIDGIVADLPIVDPMPNDEEEWVRTAMATSHAVRAAQEGLKGAEHDLKNAMSAGLPTISASASYGNNSGERSFQGIVLPDQGTTTSKSYSISLNMPLFQGLRVHAGVRQARLGLERARQNLIQQELTVSEEVRTRFLTVVTDVVRVAARDEAIKSTQAALEATQTGYEVGTRNIVDVLNAQRNLFQRQFNYHQSRYNYLLNMLRLKQSAGTLSAMDIDRLSEQMDAANPVQRGQ